ncbi:glycosyltransferase [candidate division KSB1 bacterium]|nr:glycosyltransferase [candidate division KSB1 bacterium]
MTLGQCLESLQAQKTDSSFEILVIDSSDDLTGDRIKERFPHVRLFHFDERMYCGEARNYGITKARGDIIAFIDADCIASKSWIDAISRSHQGNYDAIGGTIANQQPSTSQGWASYFCEFSQWMPGRRKQTMSDIAAANISYKKSCLQTIGPYITDTYCSDTHFHWRMHDYGLKLLFDPAIRIEHRSLQDLNTLLRHEFSHGRNFGRVRLSKQDFTGFRRLLLIVFWFLIALKKILQIRLAIYRFPLYKKYFYRSLPFIILACLGWAFGECVGYCHQRKKLPKQWKC